MNQLEDLLKKCTVKLSFREGWGTGFFVAPELILTCAHVVDRARGRPIQVRWQNHENWAEAVVERSVPDELYDLALLRVTLPTNANPPCVYLDNKIKSRDPLYLFGYPDTDFPNGCPVTGNCEGLTGDEPGFIKFAVGQVRPGMSGSPLLNQRTGKVCGIVKFTRDPSFDLGGGAVQTVVILAQFPQLVEQQQLFHQREKLWLQQIEVVSEVAQNAYQQSQAKDIILRHLEDLRRDQISFQKLREITGKADWDDKFLSAIVDKYSEVFGSKKFKPGLLGLYIKKENQAKHIILKWLEDLRRGQISFKMLREITGKADWDDEFLNAVVDKYSEVLGHRVLKPGLIGLYIKKENQAKEIILKRLKNLGWDRISFKRLRAMTAREDWDDNFLNSIVDTYSEVFEHMTFFPNCSPGLCLKADVAARLILIE